MQIMFLVVPEVNLLDLSGPAQVFSAANHFGASYDLVFAAASASVSSAQGLVAAQLLPLGNVPLGEDVTVVIPGPDLTRISHEPALVEADTIAWIRAAHENGCRVVSICTGAVVLGESGLLDGRACTSHWSVIEQMRSRYPRARVRDDVLFLRDGTIYTSAGIASGIDLALSIVESDHGAALAAKVARELVVFARPNGDSAPLSPFLSRRDHLNPAVHRVQDLIMEDLQETHSLQDLAHAVHLSPRGLSGAFVAATGTTPARYLRELRLALAENLFRQTNQPIENIAARCGFGDDRNFRRVFTSHHGISPSAFRLSTAA